jgi:hypothetical protein
MLVSILKRLFRHAPAAAAAAAAPPSGAPVEGGSWLEEALRLQRLQRYGEAADISRSVLTRDPDNADALQVLAAALLA